MKDSLIKTLLNAVNSEGSTESELSAGKAKDILTGLLLKAGKGKDDVIETIAQEIGQAVAHMLEEPLALIAKNQKLKVTFELEPKKKEIPKKKVRAKAATSIRKKVSKKASKKKTAKTRRKKKS